MRCRTGPHDAGLHLLVNPAAGRGRAARRYPRIARTLDRLRLGFQPHFSAGPGHLTEIAAGLAARDETPLVVCGGDGSVNEVLNGLPRGGGPSLGVVPCGRGDDIARNLGIPRTIADACALLTRAEPRCLDTARAGGRRYLGIGGAGLDAEVNRRANATKLPVLPQAIYAWQTLAALRTWRAREFLVEADGWRYAGRVMFVVVANAPSYGGGMRISPDSLMDDGRLEVCIVEEMGRLELLAEFPKVFGGRHLGNPHFRVLTAARVRIASAAGGDFYADGECLGRLPIAIAVEPDAVSVLGPPPLAGAAIPVPAEASLAAPA